MDNKLALFGGKKAIDIEFKKYNSIGDEELKAVKDVMTTGNLSQFLGCWDPDFFGGPKVREFEKAWSLAFGTKHSVSLNSNTSGLMAALGALDLEPGDEVIVSPWTMCATATSILIWNAIPVFADIESKTFNLDPIDVRKKVTSKTKAILVTDIFGHSADIDALLEIAKEFNLKVIEDCAQSPGAMYRQRHVGTTAHIGVYSLNYHKHIHTGEGGVCVTDDDALAERMQLIRNHAEAVVGPKGVKKINNMIGFNFRLTEVQAAIGIEQIKKLPGLVQSRTKAADRLSEGLSKLKGIRTPIVMKSCTHVYYDYPLVLDIKELGISRSRLVEALVAEGIPNIGEGYQLVHLLPIFQSKTAYGTQGFPWKGLTSGESTVVYNKGICPVAEDLHENSYLGIEFCTYEFNDKEVDAYILAFEKVWQNLDKLRL